jgi:hypothetical protein
MKHLDTLLDELQEPVAQLMDWCKEDQDRAIVACWKDMNESQKINALEDVYPDEWFVEIISIMESIDEEILLAESEDRKPDIDYEKIYSPLEHIINDRIEVYNKS